MRILRVLLPIVLVLTAVPPSLADRCFRKPDEARPVQGIYAVVDKTYSPFTKHREYPLYEAPNHEEVVAKARGDYLRFSQTCTKDEQNIVIYYRAEEYRKQPIPKNCSRYYTRWINRRGCWRE